MNADRWKGLTEWHNSWLDADPNTRERLRREFAAAQPDLAAEVDELTAASASMHGFLETPAFVLAARDLAVDTSELRPGTEVGPYLIVKLIARGGMGVVYRATDMRLQRDVALKMLMPIGAPDPFLREARITASVDHPNVVKVYDVGLFEGNPYMVTELLEGETLRARIDRGSVPMQEALRIAIDGAKGLMAAHAAGLVHRDLKPENIFLTQSNATKILDFGIATLLPDAPQRRAGASTLTGILLGTTGYLAPEQIRGAAIDGRADLFAFGSILFELATGQRAFACEETVDTLHAILHDPVPDLVRLRGDVPRAFVSIVTRLLEKTPEHRFQSAADLVWALEQVDPLPIVDVGRGAGPSSVPSAPRRSPQWRWLAVAGAIAALILAGAGLNRLRSSGAGPVSVARFTWTLPSGTALVSEPVVSPDSRRIAWAGANESGSRLFVRELASLDAVPLAGTEGARQPFWSPDGASLGFFAGGKLKRVAVDGGTPVTLADAPEAKGGTWSASGVIVFQPDYRDSALASIPARGGEVAAATILDTARDDVSHRWPVFLPDGDHFLFHVVSIRDERRGIYLGSVAAGAQIPDVPLFASETGAVYSPLGERPLGVLLAAANGRVEARPYDADGLRITGDARTIQVPAVAATPHHAALLTASPQVLAYASSPVPFGAHLATVSRDGSDLQLGPERHLGGFPRLSPDGRRLARTIVDPVRGNPDIWVDDLDRGTRLRLTTGREHDVMPVWSPDGREVVYRSGTVREPTLGFAAADGAGVTRTLPCPQTVCEPSDWSPDGRYLVVTVRGADVWSIPLEPGRSPQPLLAEAFTERDARLSPDGYWIAYVSNESGRPEVYVRSLSGPPRRYVVSRGGGDQPVWRRDGAELFYADLAGRIHAVTARADNDGRLVFGIPIRLNVPGLGERHWGTIYEVSRDGNRIFFLHPGDQRPPREIGVVMGWNALVR
jgi:serine/threonine protein kinase/Tol biopolymer transport system component